MLADRIRTRVRPSTAADPYFANVSLLFHGDEADGSSTVVDSGPLANSSTYSGATTTTAVKLFGTGSIFQTGASYLSVPSSTAFDFGSGNFTIELAVNINSVSGNRNILGKYETSATAPFVIYQIGTQVGFYASSNGTGWDLVSNLTFGSSFAASTWYLLAVTRTGNVYRTFLNGTLVSTATVSGTLVSNSEPLFFGRGNNTAPGYWTGWMDEIRITKGISRYTANYTTQSGPFPNY